MLRGIYTSASGMSAAARWVDRVANNIANLRTNGYKPQRSFFEAVFGVGPAVRADLTGRQISLGPDLVTGVSEGAKRGYVQGSLRETGDPLHVALDGPGYFQVQDAAGNILLTRDGAFRRSLDGYLTTAAGAQVLSTDGQPIALTGAGARDAANGVGTALIHIDERGRVTDSSQNTLGQLSVVEVDPDLLLQHGGDLYASAAGTDVPAADPTRTRVFQHKLEESATDLATELIDLAQAQSAFSVDRQGFQAVDDTLGRLLDSLGPRP